MLKGFNDAKELSKNLIETVHELAHAVCSH